MEQFFMCKKKRPLCEPIQDKLSFYEGIYLIGGIQSDSNAEILFRYPANRTSNIEGILPDMLFPKGIEI
jgi:hypothetical protein